MLKPKDKVRKTVVFPDGDEKSAVGYVLREVPGDGRQVVRVRWNGEGGKKELPETVEFSDTLEKA